MKKILLGVWSILFIVGLWFLFASPYFLHQKIPFSSTYQVTFFPPWNAYPRIGIPVKNGAMPDVIGQIYPWKYLVIATWKSGQIPLWNMFSFAGTPLLANYQSAVLSPFNLLFFILPFVDGWSVLVLLQPLLAAFFMYCFVRSLGISKIGSLLSAVSFMFCGFITVWMGYATLAYAFLFLPLGMYSIEKFFQTGKVACLILLSFVLPLSFFSGHFQISLYVLIALVSFAIYKSISSHSFKKTGSIFLHFLLGLLLCLPQLLPSLEFYTQSLRSGLYQRSEVIPWAYLPTLLSPDFFGNPVTRNDWFGHYAEWNGFIGTIGFLLALFSLKKWKKENVLFFFIAGILALLLALPTPIGDAIVTFHLPVLSTSAASRIICLYSFFFAVLVGFGWENLVESLKENKWKGILIWLGISTSFFATLWVVVIGKVFLPVDKIVVAKQNLFLPTILFAFFVACLFLVKVFPKKVGIILIGVVCILLVGFDMYRFASKWQSFDPKDYVFQNVPVASAFSQISGYQRVIGNYGAEVSNYYQLPSLEGYDALYPRRYGEFISYVSNGKVGESARSVVSLSRNGTYTPQAINLLNTVYVVQKNSDDNMPWTLPVWTYPRDQFSKVFEDSAYKIFKNTKAFPRAFLVGKYIVKQNDADILSTMFGKDFDLRNEVVLEQRVGNIASDSTGAATIDKYSANDIAVETHTKTNMLLFLSDPYYPGWKAYVDGKESPILRADYAFRAVEVPVGTHKVEFVYFPSSFTFGIWGFGIGIVALILSSILISKIPYK